MRIEEGKYYRTRDGRKVGPAKKQYDGRFDFDGAHSYCHAPDGKYAGRDSSLDVVAEWTDEGPIVTETVQRIKPGVYGLLRVDTYRDQMVVSIDPSDGHQPTAPELRELARVALEIAEYLENA